MGEAAANDNEPKNSVSFEDLMFRLDVGADEMLDRLYRSLSQRGKESVIQRGEV